MMARIASRLEVFDPGLVHRIVRHYQVGGSQPGEADSRGEHEPSDPIGRDVAGSGDKGGERRTCASKRCPNSTAPT